VGRNNRAYGVRHSEDLHCGSRASLPESAIVVAIFLEAFVPTEGFALVAA
jgi:hypothetical protein